MEADGLLFYADRPTKPIRLEECCETSKAYQTVKKKKEEEKSQKCMISVVSYWRVRPVQSAASRPVEVSNNDVESARWYNRACQ